MTGHGDPRGPVRVAEAAQAEGLALAGCPTPCDDDCETDCHEAHRPQSKRWHEPGWSCAEVQLAIARAVAVQREADARLAEDKSAYYAAKPRGMPYAPFADLIREKQHDRHPARP